MEVNHADRGHSALGASSSERWMKCTASNALIEKLGLKSESSKYADEGTAAHELADHCLTSNSNADGFVGSVMKFNGRSATEEMAAAVQVYLDYIRSKTTEFTEVLVEEQFDLAYIDESMFGTNDCAIIDHGESLEIVDYKHGAGVEVFAEGNTQLLYYALGAYRKYELQGTIKKITLTIVQPRIFSDKKIKSWEITEKDLLNYEAEITRIVKDIKEGNTKYESGDHCRWCLAKPHCPKLKGEAMEVLGLNKEDKAIETKNLQSPVEMDTATIQNILENGDKVKKWVDSVYAFAKAQLEIGKSIPGWKLVEGRSNRKYVSEADIIDAFGPKYGDKIYKKSLIGITEMEKLVGKKELNDLCYKPPGASTLVPESDKRPAIKSAMSELFDDIEEETKQLTEGQDSLDLDF